MAASTWPASRQRLICRISRREWKDEEEGVEGEGEGDDGGEGGAAESSIRFSDLAKSKIRVSSASQFTGMESIATIWDNWG